MVMMRVMDEDANDSECECQCGCVAVLVVMMMVMIQVFCVRYIGRNKLLPFSLYEDARVSVLYTLQT